MQAQDIWTVEDVANYLRVSERTVYEWAQKGVIPCGKLGTVWRFKREDVMRWVDENLTAVESYRQQPAQEQMLTDVLSQERIIIAENADKEQALCMLCETFSDCDAVEDVEQLEQRIFYRESLLSTGIGLGCGIPHCRLKNIRKPVMAVGIFPDGIKDYTSLDNEPVKLVFLIAAGDGQHEEHIKLLSKVSELIKTAEFRNRLVKAADVNEAWQILTQPYPTITQEK
ncbi:MAG TPA: PTS sugar transporter subunit IIA [Phycisphaerae bacterium]|nr:PTS sugar transporter subunit IIA [Phycisphaerae bacterium]HPS53025.1 PTS sugar transporter subunit IIA [Phycisphaerae bacterium]